MDEQLNNAPCGFLTLTKEGTIKSINKTLLKILLYSNEHELKGKHVNTILSKSARIFFQLYFIPLITTQKFVEEMYLSLSTAQGEDIPILINASFQTQESIFCVIVPMKKRNEFEEQLLIAKKTAEKAYHEKNEAHLKLQLALKELEEKQHELITLNQQNTNFKVETERDLQLAKNIQETALTQDITNDHIQMLSHYQASKDLSGDIYGFYQISEHQYGIILLDVMGHGIAAALITMSLRSLFHRLISKGVPAEIVMQELDNNLHSLFQNNKDAWHYCTAIYLNINTSNQTVEYINAGHPPVIFQDPAGHQQELFATSPPLGTFEGISYKSNTLQYLRGSRLLLYTDGISEPLDFNELNSILYDSLSEPLSTIKKRIIGALKEEQTEFQKYHNDDQCFILVEL